MLLLLLNALVAAIVDGPIIPATTVAYLGVSATAAPIVDGDASPIASVPTAAAPIDAAAASPFKIVVAPILGAANFISPLPSVSASLYLSPTSLLLLKPLLILIMHPLLLLLLTLQIQSDDD
jgi:hypothetical protein